MSVTVENIKVVAKAINSINEKAVFVGGSVAQFYVDGSKTQKIRITKDVDIVFQLLSFGQLESLREKLGDVGFKQKIDNKVLCRFEYLGILVDVMSVNQIGWAPGNKWFESGFIKAEKKTIDDIEIFLLPLSYYLATKFSAFNDRGINDPYLSHDLEDIVFIADNALDLNVELLENDDEEVRAFLKENFRKMFNISRIYEAVEGHLPRSFQEERLKRLKSNILKYIKTS